MLTEDDEKLAEELDYFFAYEANGHAQQRFESGAICFQIECKNDGSMEDYLLFKRTLKKFNDLIPKAAEKPFKNFEEGCDPKVEFIIPDRFR